MSPAAATWVTRGGEQLPDRAGPVLLAAQLALAVELRRRPRRRVACGRDITVPTLVIGNLADDACTPSHTRRLFDAIGTPTRRCTRFPARTTTTPGRIRGRRSPTRSASSRIGRRGMGFRRRRHDSPPGALDGIRVPGGGHADLGPFAGRLLGDMGPRSSRSNRQARPIRSGPGAGRSRRTPLLLDRARPQQEMHHAQPARATGRELFLDLVERSGHHRRELPTGHAGEVEPRLRRSAPT